MRQILIYVAQGGVLDVQVSPEMIEEFKDVIKRGTAFATQTSPEMKVFADTLLGRISYTKNAQQNKIPDHKHTGEELTQNKLEIPGEVKIDKSTDPRIDALCLELKTKAAEIGASPSLLYNINSSDFK